MYVRIYLYFCRVIRVEMTYIRFVTVGLCLMFMACSPRALHEAQRVVTEADSLRETGQIYDDSAALAQSYTTLGRWQWIHADQYAHACYHYGRILRRSDDPVAAMQVFIDATHSHTTDNHILGRVYSNMGDICHLASAYPLAYDMYECSGNRYLQNGDTLLYYYDLNNMALQLAERGKKQETYAILQNIDQNISDATLSDLTTVTKAVVCKKTAQYDSTIYYTSQLLEQGFRDPSALILRAQAFSFMGEKDSAVYYANLVLSHSKLLSQINNALYILTNDVKTDDVEPIRQTAADRSDAQKLLAERQGKLSQAAQLLEQDLNREPDLRWLYVLIATLAIIGSGCYIYVYRKRKKQQLLTQKIDILEQATSVIQEKHQELTERYLTDHKRIENEINSRCSILQTNESIKKKLAWRNYKKMCNIIDKQFYLLASKLRDKHSLKENEVRICILTLLNCSSEQMAELLYKSPTSIGTLKGRVANKLGTTSGKMRMYLIDNVCVK